MLPFLRQDPIARNVFYSMEPFEERILWSVLLPCMKIYASFTHRHNKLQIFYIYIFVFRIFLLSLSQKALGKCYYMCSSKKLVDRPSRRSIQIFVLFFTSDKDSWVPHDELGCGCEYIALLEIPEKKMCNASCDSWY